MEAALSNHVCGFQPTKEQEMQVGYGSLAAVVDTLAQAVAGQQFIAGDRLSAADVYVGSQIGWGMRPVSDSIGRCQAFNRLCRRRG